MRSGPNRAAAGRRGVSSIEMALVLPVLLALIFGILDWSMYMYAWLNVGVVANQGVRLGAGDEQPVEVALGSICTGLRAYAMSCSDGAVTAVVANRGSGPVLEVSIDLAFDPPVGLAPTPDRLYASATTSWYGQPED